MAEMCDDRWALLVGLAIALRVVRRSLLVFHTNIDEDVSKDSSNNLRFLIREEVACDAEGDESVFKKCASYAR